MQSSFKLESSGCRWSTNETGTVAVTWNEGNILNAARTSSCLCWPLEGLGGYRCAGRQQRGGKSAGSEWRHGLQSRLEEGGEKSCIDSETVGGPEDALAVFKAYCQLGESIDLVDKFV